MSRLDYAAIRQRISIRCVLDLVDYRPSHCHGPQWRGPCPLLGCSQSARPSSDRSFSVNVERHLFRCFRCGLSGSQLDLWRQLTGMPLHPATLDLCRRLSIAPVELSDLQPPDRR